MYIKKDDGDDIESEDEYAPLPHRRFVVLHYINELSILSH